MAIRLVSLSSNSETHMTAICDARLIYGRGRISPVFICGAVLRNSSKGSASVHLYIPYLINQGCQSSVERKIAPNIDSFFAPNIDS